MFPWVVLSYISIYLFKQAFSIPGSVLLNMLSGAMFGDWPGFALVCVLTGSNIVVVNTKGTEYFVIACGTSCCYIISSLFGKRLADRLFGAKIFRVQKAIDNHRSNLFLYLLALRVFPFTPNFFLNLCSPLVGVPFLHFFFSVFFGTYYYTLYSIMFSQRPSCIVSGLMPYNFLTVKAGGILSELDDVNQIFDTQNLLKLVVLATLILLPTFCKSRLIKIANLDLAENSPAKVKSS